MAGLCFFFEENDIDVYSGRDIDLDAWYLASCIPGDIDSLIVVNRTDQKLKSPNDDLKEFRVVSEVPELESAAVLVCPWNTDTSESVYSFCHDVEWYIFGPSEGWRNEFPAGELINVPQRSRGACHAVHVATTVMFLRYDYLRWPLH